MKKQYVINIIVTADMRYKLKCNRISQSALQPSNPAYMYSVIYNKIQSKK